MSQKTVGGAIAFLIFSFVVLVPGGGSEILFDAELDKGAFKFEPSVPDADFDEINLSTDFYSKENVTFVSADSVNASDYPSDTVAVLENGSSSGSITFNTPDAVSVETKTTKYGFLTDTRLELCDNVSCVDLKGLSTTNLADDANFFTINFLDGPEDEPVVYSISVSEREPSGLVDRIGAGVSEVASIPIELFELFAQFPWFVQAFYGGVFAWMIAQLLSIG